MQAWPAYLIDLGVTAPGAGRLATEAALVGRLEAHGLLRDAVIVSDGAGQFNVLEHGLCWIHAERSILRPTCVTEEQRAQVAFIRHLIRWFYRDLKLYREQPTAAAEANLKARFDRIFERATGFADLDQAWARIWARKSELLVVLDRPAAPLNSTDSERDIHAPVSCRKLSAGTRADDGRRCRDTFLSLNKTCRKNGIHFWDYLGDRLAIAAGTVA